MSGIKKTTTSAGAPSRQNTADERAQPRDFSRDNHTNRDGGTMRFSSSHIFPEAFYDIRPISVDLFVFTAEIRDG